jgi:hypothetical protein
MSTTVVESSLLTTDNVLSGALPVPLPQVESDLSLSFDVPDFNLQLTLVVTEIDPELDSGKLVFEAAIDDAILILTALGKLNEDGFKIEHINIDMERGEGSAQTGFVTSTVRATLVLANKVNLRISGVNFEGALKFDEPLFDTSQLLRRRQILYRIMVIERASGHKFNLPIDMSGDEVRDITLAYHAIVEHSFIWPINSITVFFPATKEWSNTLLRLKQETSIPIGPDPFTLQLFGQKINLGRRGIIIKDAVIEDFEIARKELSKGDGHLVPIVIRSLSGQARYDFFEVPQSTITWDANIQKMVELESQLDARLVERYTALAAATLEGLTEVEKAEVTTRPELGEAFLIDDSDGG